MNTSTFLDGSTSAQRFPVPRESVTEQLQGLSTIHSLYPQLESIERTSNDYPRVHIPFSGVDTPTTTSADSSGGLYSAAPTAASLAAQQTGGPSVISSQLLPTYRQVTMIGGGSHPLSHPSSAVESPSYQIGSSLPDILHSHMLPQIPPARPNQHRNRSRRSEDEGVVRGNRNRQRTHGDRSGRSRRASSRTHSTSSSQTQENSCKEPCVKCVVTVTSFRWVLVVLSVLGVSCVVAGIVLAALHPAIGTSLLYLSVMFIGLGVLLVIVVGVGWKCTPRGHEPLHALFGIGSFRHRRAREGRRGRYRNRDRNWFGGMLYPEFQYRRPPPSYAASMQDYQNQVSHEQDENSGARNTIQSDGDSLPNSPPPSYRSRASTAHSVIHHAFPCNHDGDHPHSRPPTYRSRAPSRRPSLPQGDIIGQTVLGSEIADRVVHDIPFMETSNVHISTDGIHTDSVIVSSASLSFPNHSSLGPAAKEVPSNSNTLKQLASSSQVHSVPFSINSQNDFQNPSVLPFNTSNFSSDISPSSSSSSQNQHNFTSQNQTGQRPPSLHQRMPSEDRHILEQTLQSLEEHMNENAGIMNRGANFDDPEHVTDPVHTHL